MFGLFLKHNTTADPFTARLKKAMAKSGKDFMSAMGDVAYVESPPLWSEDINKEMDDNMIVPVDKDTNNVQDTTKPVRVSRGSW